MASWFQEVERLYELVVSQRESDPNDLLSRHPASESVKAEVKKLLAGDRYAQQNEILETSTSKSGEDCNEDYPTPSIDHFDRKLSTQTSICLQSLHEYGGMGLVFRATDESTDRRIAIKTLQAKFVDNDNVKTQFQNEAVVTARLQHPGIVPVHGIGQDKNGNHFLRHEVC